MIPLEPPVALSSCSRRLLGPLWPERHGISPPRSDLCGQNIEGRKTPGLALGADIHATSNDHPLGKEHGADSSALATCQARVVLARIDPRSISFIFASDFVHPTNISRRQ